MDTSTCKVAGLPDSDGLPVPAPSADYPIASFPSPTVTSFATAVSAAPAFPEIAEYESDAGNIAHSLRVLPSWLISMFLHVGVLVTLACVTRQVDLGTVISLVVSPADQTELGNIELALEPLPVDTESAQKLDRQASELPDAAKLSLSVELASRVDTTGLESVQLDSELWGTTTGEGVAYRSLGEGLGDLADVGEEGDKAQFFGISARGSSFVFVIDCSGSMGGPRWNAARNELIRSMRNLKPDQQFCILLYSSFATSFEGNVNKAQYVAATPENLDLMTRWLNIQVPAGGTLPLPAVKVALELQPDAIFLLSDGELQDDTRGFLFKINVQSKAEEEIVPIHTVSAGMSMGAQLLEVISTENRGIFQQVW